MAKQTAAEFVTAAMQDCLPPGVPLSFTIDWANFMVATGPKAWAAAQVTMFDGLPAQLEVHRWGDSHKHRWVAMMGGDASFEDGRWIRIDRETMEPITPVLSA